MPIGIPGSGKTRLYHLRYSHLPIISVDLLRKELYGDVNTLKSIYDESNRRVWEMVNTGQSFYYDATNVNTKFRKRFVNQFRGKDVDITYVVLPANVDLSYKRITEDIKNNVERGNVPYEKIVYKYQLYKEAIDNQFAGENVKKIIYIQPGELD